MPITTEHLAALRSAEQYAVACDDALRLCLCLNATAVLGLQVIELTRSAWALKNSIESLRVAAEADAGLGGQE